MYILYVHVLWIYFIKYSVHERSKYSGFFFNRQLHNLQHARVHVTFALCFLFLEIQTYQYLKCFYSNC